MWWLAYIQIAMAVVSLAISARFLHQCHHLRIENRDLRLKMYAATYFANVLAERGVGLRCDDCGNLMTTDQDIDILEIDDRTYVGHRSHGRGFDERIKRGLI